MYIKYQPKVTGHFQTEMFFYKKLLLSFVNNPFYWKNKKKFIKLNI